MKKHQTNTHQGKGIFECRMGLDFYRYALPQYLNDGIGKAILKIAQETNESNVISFPTRYDWIRAHQVKTFFLIAGFQDIVRDHPDLTEMPPEFEDLQQQLSRYIEMADEATKEMQCRLDFGGEPQVGGDHPRPNVTGVNRAA